MARGVTMAGVLAPWMLVAAAAAPAQTPGTAQAAIEAMMADSVAGWNAGDLARFVAVYADDAIYASGTELASGKGAITARYAPSFAKGGNTRGTLTLRPVAWRPLSAVHVMMVGRWSLSAAGGKVQTGLTTLLFERRKAGWRIISDHSS